MRLPSLDVNMVDRLRKVFSIKRIFLAVLVFLPAAVNFLVWSSFVRPAERTVVNLSSLGELVAYKPRIEKLIAEADQLTSQGVVKRLVASEADVILGEIRELAKIHSVDVKELRIPKSSAGQGSVSVKSLEAQGLKSVPVLLEVSGSYPRIARWWGSLDKRVEVRVDNFILTPTTAGNCELSLKLRFLLKSL